MNDAEYKRERALGRFVILKKQIYELGVKAQSLVKEIQDETDSFLTDKDFTTMDFEKVETLAKQLFDIQNDFTEKAKEMDSLKTLYNLNEVK